jgi:predicted RNA-binding protein (virulence factor B family)
VILKLVYFWDSETDPEFDILLPNKYVPNEFEIGEELIVFVYLDHEERQLLHIRTLYLT